MHGQGLHFEPESFSDPTFGTFEDTGLDAATCFSAEARYRPYGYSGDDDDKEAKDSAPSKVKWEDVKWGKLQRECNVKNRNRYKDFDPVNQSTIFRYAEYADIENIDDALSFWDAFEESKGKKIEKEGARFKRRSAVVFQMPEAKEWTLDTTQYMRSIIMELSLHTGGEYEVFILIGVEDDSQPIFNNPGVHQKILERSVPREFQGMSYLFNQRLLAHWYLQAQALDNVRESSHDYAPLQLLSMARPDIDFFWHMDIDARYTGHHYDYLEKVGEWSKAQPREVLWEIASQVYMKGFHQSWSEFTAQIKSAARRSTIRGPLKTNGITPTGPRPPMMLQGKDRWGIGEDADLITFGQVFDPEGSLFSAKWEVDNYPDGVEGTPKRATPFATMTRTSKRLLRAMHHGQVTQGTNMSPLMFPASTALHHGLKVVAFPTPIYLDATIPPEQLHEEFNSEWGRHTYDSPYKYSDVWARMTFAIAAWDESTFADQLYKKWLGYDERHTKGICLPGIMLHPIQGV